MSLTEDPQRLVADLRPASLDRLAEDGYQRHRNADLSRLMAEPARHSRRLTRAGAWRPRVLIGTAIGATATAVAVSVALTVPSSHGSLAATPGGHPAGSPGSAPSSSPAGAPGSSPASSAAGDSSQAILLSAAHTAARRPATTGTYWYVKQRDFEPAYPAGKVFPDYVASYAATEESWVGATRTRTIVNEDLVFNFASAADKAKWRAAGSPKLATPAGPVGYTKPVTSNYDFGGYSTNEGVIKVSITTARKLPTTPGKLDAMLRRQWNQLSAEQQRENGPTYANFVFATAEALLTGPVTPGTRSAVYRLLARQPGLTTATKVTDPLGRVGVAIGDAHDGFLVISPATAEVLDQTSDQVRAGATIPAAGNGTEAYLQMHWTNRLP